MICAVKDNSGYIKLKDISRIRSWFLSRENKDITQLFMYFMKQHIDVLDENMDIELIFNLYFLLLTNEMLDEEAFNKTLERYSEEGI